MEGVSFAVVVMALWATSLAIQHERPAYIDERNGTTKLGDGLILLEASPNRLRGQYFGTAGGIFFEVDTTKGHHFFTINSLEAGGGQLLSAKRHFLRESSPISISLLDSHFIVNHDMSTSGRKEYLVPQPFHKYVEHRLKHTKAFHHLKKHLDEREVNKTRSAAIGQFLASKEAALVVQTALSLGERGYIGRESPAAMMLYILASRVQNLLESRTKKDLETGENSRGVLKRQVRAVTSASEEFCENVQHSCPSGKCPQGSECTGLCGMSCNCWEWVCGNCCLNKMCLDHDNYCSDDGLLSWCCLGIIVKDMGTDIDCDKPYVCSE